MDSEMMDLTLGSSDLNRRIDPTQSCDIPRLCPFLCPLWREIRGILGLSLHLPYAP